MKTLGMFLAAVILAAALAGCSSDSSGGDPVGSWGMVWDWSCDGTDDGSGAIHLFENGTLIDSAGDTGNWTKVDDSVTLNYTFGAVYNGTIHGDKMEGNYYLTDGTGGCWSATKLSDTP